ncbi:autotransporter domain-containing protein [Methyloferula stellata]|uniref:autotransporter domain-containing protein n=1 Tax=Methyloferula stellata TaxID=876270 RepID=UPI001AEBB52A|nr:autotransporter domain-containing protein [Methyloferula stellata]
MTALKCNRSLMKISFLSIAAVSALIAAPTRAATIVVNNQAQFDAAVVVATQPGHADTIDASTAGTIDAGTSLTLPGSATSINLTFGTLGIGTNVADGTTTLGAGTTVSFGQTNNPGEFNMGFGHTGTLNINGASLIFNVTNAGTQFNIGLDGGNGIVNMTSGAVTINDSGATPGVFGSMSIGYPFGTTAANGTFNQSGGTVSVSAGALNVGVANGTGTYNLTGTAVLQDRGATVYIGGSAGGVGNVNISGNAILDFESISAGANGQLYVGDNLGIGTITQNGADTSVTLNVANIAQFGSNASAGPGGGGTGTYNLLAGTLEIGGLGAAFGMDVGGVGFLTQSGGTLIAAAPVIIGNSGTGTYSMTGGTANFGAGLRIALLAGSTGTVNQTGGLVTISGGVLTVGVSGVATYNLNGGLLQVGGTNGITGTGSLNLGGGALQVIGSALTTNVAMGLTGTGSIIDTNGFGATFGGVMSGAGGFTKIGAGTLVLTGANIYGGATTIAGGTLQIGNGGTTGSIVGDVIDNAALVFNRSNASAFSGAISGMGSVTKLGAGILTLSGPGTYAGPTFVSAGTLQVAAANVFSQSSAYTIATGATLDLNNFNNAIGSLAGSGTVALGSATLTSGNDGTSTSFSGAIGGTGGLTKIGGGVLALTGTSTYTGPTNINGGILDVNGSLASTVSVNSGGTLMGSGTIGGLNVASGGTVAPGNSIGTLHVAGNVGFAAGSVYQVEVNQAGQSDLIAATGHATLAGGNVQVSGTAAVNHTYTILTAQGGVSGTFSGASSNFVFLNPQLTYTPDSVLLDFQQTRSFLSAAVTPNQTNVAVALAGLPPNSPLYQAVLMQTSAAGAQQAFNALSGEVHASAQAVMVDDSRYVRQAVLGRMRQMGYDNAVGPMSALGSGGPQVAYAESAAGFVAHADPAAAPMAYADARGSAPLLPSILPLGVPVPETAWWAQGVGAWGRLSGDSNVATVSRDLAGFFTGVDRRFGENWRAGIAGGYTNSSVNDSGRASSANIDTTHIGTYAGGNYGPWNFRAGSAISVSTVSTDRSIIFPGFGDNASARYGAVTAQVFSEVGYGMALGTIAAEPFAGLAWVHLSTDSFLETGSTMAALNGLSSQNNVGYSTLGARIATNYILPNGMVLTPRASASWQHAFGDVKPDAVLAFEGSVSPFAVAGVPLARDAALVETGLDLRVAPLATIGISYTGQIAQGVQDHSVKGSLLIRF